MNPEQNPRTTDGVESMAGIDRGPVSLRVAPFLGYLAVAMVLAVGVVMLARWFDGALMTEPGLLGRLGHAVAGHELVPGELEEVGIRSTLTATTVGGLLGWLVGVVVARWTSRPRLVFSTITVAGFIGWGLMAFTHAETTATGLWLNATHIVVAVPIIGGLARQLPASRGRMRRGGGAPMDSR